MFYKLYSEKKKRIYLPTYPYLNLWVGFGQTEIFLMVALMINLIGGTSSAHSFNP